MIEQFFSFLDCSDARKAEELLNLIKSILEKIWIFSIPIVSQSYDGAAVISGVANGLQKLLNNYHPNAIYIHCMSHRLNLSLVNASKNNKYALIFFNVLETLY